MIELGDDSQDLASGFQTDWAHFVQQIPLVQQILQAKHLQLLLIQPAKRMLLQLYQETQLCNQDNQAIIVSKSQLQSILSSTCYEKDDSKGQITLHEAHHYLYPRPRIHQDI